jgi:hypothetical protein
MFTHKTMQFLMMVLTISFCYFVSNLWEHGGLLWIMGTIVSTMGITMIFCMSEADYDHV